MKETFQIPCSCKLIEPVGGNRRSPVGRARQTTGDATSRIGIAAKVYCFQSTFTEASGIEQAPQTGIQRMQDISGRDDFPFG
jgi:hypothetical protein